MGPATLFWHSLEMVLISRGSPCEHMSQTQVHFMHQGIRNSVWNTHGNRLLFLQHMSQGASPPSLEAELALVISWTWERSEEQFICQLWVQQMSKAYAPFFQNNKACFKQCSWHYLWCHLLKGEQAISSCMGNQIVNSLVHEVHWYLASMFIGGSTVIGNVEKWSQCR